MGANEDNKIIKVVTHQPMSIKLLTRDSAENLIFLIRHLWLQAPTFYWIGREINFKTTHSV